MPFAVQNTHDNWGDIYADESITRTNKINSIIWSTWHDIIVPDDVEVLLRSMPDKKEQTIGVYSVCTTTKIW